VEAALLSLERDGLESAAQQNNKRLSHLLKPKLVHKQALEIPSNTKSNTAE
jgi:hypothetical protein